MFPSNQLGPPVSLKSSIYLPNHSQKFVLPNAFQSNQYIPSPMLPQHAKIFLSKEMIRQHQIPISKQPYLPAQQIVRNYEQMGLKNLRDSVKGLNIKDIQSSQQEQCITNNSLNNSITQTCESYTKQFNMTYPIKQRPLISPQKSEGHSSKPQSMIKPKLPPSSPMLQKNESQPNSKREKDSQDIAEKTAQLKQAIALNQAQMQKINRVASPAMQKNLSPYSKLSRPKQKSGDMGSPKSKILALKITPPNVNIIEENPFYEDKWDGDQVQGQGMEQDRDEISSQDRRRKNSITLFEFNADFVEKIPELGRKDTQLKDSDSDIESEETLTRYQGIIDRLSNLKSETLNKAKKLKVLINGQYDEREMYIDIGQMPQQWSIKKLANILSKMYADSISEGYEMKNPVISILIGRVHTRRLQPNMKLFELIDLAVSGVLGNENLIVLEDNL